MRRAAVIALVGCTLAIGCRDAPGTSTAARPPANPPASTPAPAPAKPDPLQAFDQTPFCKQFGCKREKSWPLREGGTNNMYDLTAASDVAVEVQTKDGAIDGYGLSLYERERLRDRDFQVVNGLLSSLDPAGGSTRVQQFIRSNIERNVEQIKLARSARVGGYTVWAGRIGGTQTVSVERVSGPGNRE